MATELLGPPLRQEGWQLRPPREFRMARMDLFHGTRVGSVAVARDDLGGQGLGPETEPRHHLGLDVVELDQRRDIADAAVTAAEGDRLVLGALALTAVGQLG